MARRKHYAASGRALPWIVISSIALAVVAGGAFLLFSGGGDEAEDELPVADLAFETGFTTGVPVGEPPPQRVIDDAGTEIEGILDRLYTIGFVDPALWEGGAFSSLPSLFAPQAAEAATADLENLTLGSAAPRVARVDPGKSRLKVSVLVDEDRTAVSAIARVNFRGQGTTKGGKTFQIFHRGTYFLEPTQGAWAIVGYDVIGEFGDSLTPVGQPQPGPTTEATP